MAPSPWETEKMGSPRKSLRKYVKINQGNGKITASSGESYIIIYLYVIDIYIYILKLLHRNMVNSAYQWAVFARGPPQWISAMFFCASGHSTTGPAFWGADPGVASVGMLELLHSQRQAILRYRHSVENMPGAFPLLKVSIAECWSQLAICLSCGWYKSWPNGVQPFFWSWSGLWKL